MIEWCLHLGPAKAAEPRAHHEATVAATQGTIVSGRLTPMQRRHPLTHSQSPACVEETHKNNFAGGSFVWFLYFSLCKAAAKPRVHENHPFTPKIRASYYERGSGPQEKKKDKIL